MPGFFGFGYSSLTTRLQVTALIWKRNSFLNRAAITKEGRMFYRILIGAILMAIGVQTKSPLVLLGFIIAFGDILAENAEVIGKIAVGIIAVVVLAKIF